MASVFPGTYKVSHQLALPSGQRLARGMSRHASFALLMFAAWQAWMSVALKHLPGGAALPWLALVLLTLCAIPYARHLERRWQRFAATSFPCPALVAAYHRDRARVWILAFGVPVGALMATILAAELLARAAALT